MPGQNFDQHTKLRFSGLSQELLCVCVLMWKFVTCCLCKSSLIKINQFLLAWFLIYSYFLWGFFLFYCGWTFSHLSLMLCCFCHKFMALSSTSVHPVPDVKFPSLRAPDVSHGTILRWYFSLGMDWFIIWETEGPEKNSHCKESINRFLLP